MLESVPCNICGSDSYRPLFKKKDPISNRYFDVVICSRCGLGYVNPRPLPEVMKSYYQENYYLNRFARDNKLARGNQGIIFRLYEFYRRKFSRYYPDRVLATERKICNFYKKEKGKLLDIGCANGDFLKIMKDDNFEVSGLEFSDHFVNKYGLEIFKGNLTDADYDNDCFDMVTMWAVLEHVSDPMSYLQEIYRILKPGGVVIFLVPNLSSVRFGLCHNDDIPRHLYLFSPRTIRKLLKLSDLKLKAIIHNNSIFYGGIRGCLLQMVLRGLGFDCEKVDDLNKPIVDLLVRKELGPARYFVALLSLADVIVSIVLTPLLRLFRYNGVIIVIAEK